MRRALLWIAAVAVVVVVVGLAVLLEDRILGDVIDHEDIGDFYDAPPATSPEASGEPGEIVKIQELADLPIDARAWRLMYHSRDLHGEPVLATAIAVAPGLVPADGPDGERTVLAWGHPTTGSAQHCAPSLSIDPFIAIEGLEVMLARGYTVVATDYTGMGVAGPDSYLVGSTQAHNLLDAVRAVQAVPEAHAGSDVVLWGHSQGGQAVLFAAQEAEAYAPELSVLAVAAAAPAADLGALLRSHENDVSGVTIGSYALTTYATIYADRGADLDTMLSAPARAAAEQIDDLCLLTQMTEIHEIAQPFVGSFLEVDPTTASPWQELLAENSAGATGFDAPLLVVQGSDDTLVVPADTRRYVARAEETGVDVTFQIIDGATHGTIAYLALPTLWDWLDAHGV